LIGHNRLYTASGHKRLAGPKGQQNIEKSNYSAFGWLIKKLTQYFLKKIVEIVTICLEGY